MRDTLEFAGTIVSSGAAATSVKNRVGQPASHYQKTYILLSKGGKRRLTRHGKVLTGRDGADAREGNRHEGRGIKSRQELGDDLGIGEMGFNGGDAQGSVVGSLGINEGAQERKSDCGCEEKHSGEMDVAERLQK